MRDKSREAVKTYDAIAREYTKIFFTDFSDKEELDRFISLLPRYARVLDIGCGPGNFTRYFIKKGFACEGIDLSREMITIAREKVPEGTFKVMDLRKVRYPANSFDGLLVAYSFMHIPKKDAKPSLLRFKSILKKRGVALFMAKEGHGERFLKEPLNPKLKCYIRLWQMDELKYLLKKCDFDIVFSSRGRMPTTPGELKYKKITIIAKNRK